MKEVKSFVRLSPDVIAQHRAAMLKICIEAQSDTKLDQPFNPVCSIVVHIYIAPDHAKATTHTMAAAVEAIGKGVRVTKGKV